MSDAERNQLKLNGGDLSFNDARQSGETVKYFKWFGEAWISNWYLNVFSNAAAKLLSLHLEDQGPLNQEATAMEEDDDVSVSAEGAQKTEGYDEARKWRALAEAVAVFVDDIVAKNPAIGKEEANATACATIVAAMDTSEWTHFKSSALV